MEVIHISVGGPVQTIQVNGKRHRFEMHPYCGPIAVSKRGDELKSQPQDFLYAASMWAQQGQKTDESGLCIWEHPSEEEPITQHMGGRHHKVIGYKTIPARKGE